MRKIIGLAGMAALLLTGCGLHISYDKEPETGRSARPEPSVAAPATFDVAGDVFVPSTDASKSGKLGNACVPAAGFRDLKTGTPVTVRNNVGQVTGTGKLEAPRNGTQLFDTFAAEGCVLDFTVTGVPNTGGPWTVHIAKLPVKAYEPVLINGRDLGYPVQWDLVMA